MTQGRAEDATKQKRELRQDEIGRLINEGKYTQAEPLLVQAQLTNPVNSWVLNGLGIIYRATGRYQAAEASYRRALEHNPAQANIHSNLANLLMDMDRVEESITTAARAVELEPDSTGYRKNYAYALREAKRFDESIEQLKRCLEKEGDDPNLNFDIAHISLYQRNLDEAWRYFNWRFKTGKMRLPELDTIPRWDGKKDLSGSRFLILGEQGYGDTLLMTRFIPEMARRCKELSLVCAEILHPLLANQPVRCITEDDIKPEEHDEYIQMMSLPEILEPDWLDWPASVPVTVPEASLSKYSWLAGHEPGRLKVGFIWSGSITFQKNAKRAVELERFLDLAARNPQAQFYSFQKGAREADFKTSGLAPVLPLGHSFEDFGDTAAALEHMDLFIMTDSAVAHLCGILGVPVLNLLNYRPYWLYFPEEPTTPLYASMRFIRQTGAGVWDPVFDTTSEIIAGLAREREKAALSRDQVLALIDRQIT